MTSKRNTATDPVSNLRLELLQMNMCGNDVVYKKNLYARDYACEFICIFSQQIFCCRNTGR